MSGNPVIDLPFAFHGPCGSGVIRTEPEDFRVDEITVTEPDGEGEHALLQVEKRNANTDWVARLLAKHAGVKERDVSYAGKKDRNAVTSQWFSVHLPGKPDPDWSALESPELKILQVARHGRKLRTGALRGNRFTIRVRGFSGDEGDLRDRIGLIEKHGIANYFGEQRFGHHGNNLRRARALFAGELKRLSRNKRGIYLSAARSHLFNQVLARRVAEGTWDTPMNGERFLLAGSRSSFLAEAIDQELLDRYREGDIHLSGPLWGRGEIAVSGEVAELEREVLAAFGEERAGLEQFGMKMERRSLRAPVGDLGWSLENDTLELTFTLPKGSYATALLRECVDCREDESGRDSY
ncbi:MAG: tRNA pseudouridine(13) synthase TruD [Sedimenticola sp.]